MCLLLVSLGLIPVLLLVLLYHRQYGYWKRHGVNGPRPVPLFGNLFEYVLGKKHYGDIYGEIYKDYSNAKYVGVYKMSTPSLLVRDLDLVHNVMSRNFGSFEQNDFVVLKEQDSLLYENPFCKTGTDWKEGRALVTPLLTISKVKTMFPGVKNACDKLGLYLSSCAEKEFEGKLLFNKYVVESVAVCGFGLDAGCFDDESSEFLVNSQSIFQPNLLKNLAVLFFPSLLKPLAVTFIPPKMDKWLRSIVGQVMKQRREGNLPRNDFLQAIMSHRRNGQELSENEIVGNCLMFLSEGSETSAITLTYAFYELARNPEVQQKLFEEVISSGEMTPDSIANMKYLEQVVFETLRLHTPVATITRICNSPLEIESQYGDSMKRVVIQPGMKMVIPIQEIHMDSNHFPNPEKFDPTRFSKENQEDIKKMSILSFGEGPRLCLGKVFGMFQVKACIMTVLSKYKVELSDRMTEPPKQSPKSFTLFCDTGVWIKLIPRK